MTGEVGGVKKSGVGGVDVPMGGVDTPVEGVDTLEGGVDTPVGGVGRVNTCAVEGVGGRLGVFLSRTTIGLGGGIYSFMLGISGASSQSLSDSSSLSNFSCKQIIRWRQTE